jgi:hypothetical protein
MEGHYFSLTTKHCWRSFQSFCDVWLISNVCFSGFVGRILSWKGFVVFSRISYSVYLTQFPIFFYNVGSRRAAVSYSPNLLVSILTDLNSFMQQSTWELQLARLVGTYIVPKGPNPRFWYFTLELLTRHNSGSCFVWVWNLVSHPKGRA